MTELTNFYKTNDKEILTFNWDVAKNNFQSEKEQRPIFDKVLMVTVRSPGQQKSVAKLEIMREFGDGKKKFSAYYDRYKKYSDDFMTNGDGGKLQGTPIEKWEEITMERAAALKAINVLTVESLVELPDTALHQVGMDARKLQAKAKAYIDARKGDQEAMKIAEQAIAEKEELKKELETKNLELTERINMLEKMLMEDKPKEDIKKKD